MIEEVFEQAYQVLCDLRDRTTIPVYALISSMTQEQIKEAIAALD